MWLDWNTGADNHTAMKRMSLQQIQMESYQQIKRLKDKKKKTRNSPFPFLCNSLYTHLRQPDARLSE
jgi:hypothetical protein